MKLLELKDRRGRAPHAGLTQTRQAGMRARGRPGLVKEWKLDLLTRMAMRRLPDYLPGLLLIAAMWACLAMWISWDRTTEIQAARSAASTLTETLAAHSRQVLGEADRLSAWLAREVRRQGPGVDLAALSEQGLVTPEVVQRIAITDADGEVRASTQAAQVGTSLAGSDAVRAQLDPARRTQGLYVGKPDAESPGTMPAIQLSRAVTDPGGALIGVVSLVMDPAYFTSLYRLLHIGPQGMVTLFGTDDYMVRTRRTPASDAQGDVLAAGSLLRNAVANASQGTLRGISPIDGVERLSSYQVLSPYPLVVVVGYATEEFLEAFRRRRDLLILAGLFMTALIVTSELRRVALWRRLAASALRERGAMEQQAEKAAKLQALFKAIPDAAIAFSDGVVDSVNPRLGLLLGEGDAERAQWTPERLAELFFSNDLSEDREAKQRDLAHALAAVEPGASRRRVYTLSTPRISVFEFRIEALQAPYAGMVALVRDITAQTQVDRMKSEFVSTAAHELRTPTAGILGLSELLAADRVPESRKQSLYVMIRNQAQSLSTLVADLLDLARIEARADKDFNMTEFNAADALESAVDRLPGLRERLVRDGEYAHVAVRGDFQRIESAVRNLLENCIKYSEADTPITVGVHKAGEHVEIRVADQGIGIGKEDQARVFDKFYRVNKNGAIPGTGLGLAMVKEIVQLHGGTVRLESRPGVGTTVIVSIPALA